MKCDDGSFLYCATAEQVPDEILNAIKYPHIPSALERRNGTVAQAAQVAEEEDKEERAEEHDEDESDSDSKYEAQFAAAEGNEADHYTEW